MDTPQRRMWKITIWDQRNALYANDVAADENEARMAAGHWTGQRGQMRWTAIVYNPGGTKVATYKRGKEAP